jgi:hypothetical protein
MIMAWIFSLSAECGQEKIAAERFSEHFDKITLFLTDDQQSQCHTNVFQDMEENWWCRVCPNNISEVGIDTPESAYRMTEVGILLYKHLKSAPSFRYALVGVEVDEFRTYTELLEESSTLEFPGLVLAKNLEIDDRLLLGFRPFESGYIWKPYEGEVYKPLVVSSELKNQMQELLMTAI